MPAQAAPDELAPGLADDVADEEDAHRDSLHGRDRLMQASPLELTASAAEPIGGQPIAIGIALPRRSLIFGIETRSSPLASVARAFEVSQARPRRTTRAKRP